MPIARCLLSRHPRIAIIQNNGAYELRKRISLVGTLGIILSAVIKEAIVWRMPRIHEFSWLDRYSSPAKSNAHSTIFGLIQ